MTTEFDPAMINTFKKGITDRDPELVQEALNNGVDAATPVNARHPLLTLLVRPTLKLPKPENDIKANTSRIINKLLEGGMKLTEPEKYVTRNYDYLIDRLLLSDQLDDVTNLVIHAIHETVDADRPAYKPDITRQIAGYINQMADDPAQADYKSQVGYVMTMLENVHETVRKRLAAPKTMIERDLAQNYDEEIKYWTAPFERMPLRLAFAELGLQANGAPPAAPSGEDAEKAAKKRAAQAMDEKFANEMAQYVQKIEKKSPQAVLAEMQDEFIGLDGIKRDARKMMLREQFEASRVVMDLPSTEKSHSTVLLGNPGTGKTTIARKKAELLHALGISGPNYVEVSRENLVAGYVGQTEQKMLALFMQADVVFIDEAYNLTEGKENSVDFGKNVVNALLLALENRRDNLTIFFAGYPEEMESFLTSNPGLKSRIGTYQTIEDPTMEDLGKVLDLRLKKSGFTIEPEARQVILQELEDAKKRMGAKYFGNNREVRKIIEHIPDAVAERVFGDETGLVVPDKDMLTRVTRQDVESLNLKEMLGGKTPDKPATGYSGTKIGFTAKI